MMMMMNDRRNLIFPGSATRGTGIHFCRWHMGVFIRFFGGLRKTLV